MTIHALLCALPADSPRPRGFGALFQATGFAGPLLLLLGAIALVLAIRRWLELRPGALAPEPLQRGLGQAIRDGKTDEALSQAAASRSCLGNVAVGGLQLRTAGLDEMMSGVERAAIKESLRYSNRIANLGRLGVIVLMVGVLGTVLGLMSTMQFLAAVAEPRLSDLAAGAGESLACTALGLAIALPSFAAHFLLENRLARRSLDVREIAEELMSAAAPRTR